MAENPIVFALANPRSEVEPEEVEQLAAVIATGRSDYPNQINNVLAFPGVFRGALDVRARTITPEMELAAAHAIAAAISDDELAADYIVPSVFDRSVAPNVAQAVSAAAVAGGVARDHQEAPRCRLSPFLLFCLPSPPPFARARSSFSSSGEPSRLRTEG